MNKLQKTGGMAALTLAFAYLVGFAMFFVLLDPGKSLDPVEWVGFMAEKQNIMFATMLFIYVIAGFVLVVLVQALYQRLKLAAPALIQISAVFGFIWAGIVIAAGMIFIIGMDTVVELYPKDPAQAASIWLTVGIVFEGLGGGIESVGGVWVVLISWAVMRSEAGPEAFPRVLSYLGLLVGAAGIVTIIPVLKDLTIIFGLGQIPWFIWVGMILLRNNQGQQFEELV